MLKHRMRLPGKRTFFTAGLVISLVVVTAPSSVAASDEVRCYRDEQGRIHITNIPNSPQYELIYEEPQAAPLAARVDPSLRFAEHIEEAANRHQLSPLLIQSVIRAESNFQQYAVSHAGARGLMQLMPFTAREMGVTSIFDAGQNIDGGCRYLRMQLDRFRDVRLALAAYNAGPEAVERYGGIPPYQETQTYVRRVLRFYEEYGGTLDAVESGAEPAVEENPIFIYRGPDGQIHLSNIPRTSEGEDVPVASR